MPIPSFFFLAFALGVGASIGARRELRVQPRPALLSRGFAAFMLFVTFVLVPVSVYFYAFHGDWSVLYLVDTRRIPSAIALFVFMLQAAVAAMGFATGASFVRGQRDWVAGSIAGVAAGLAVVVVLMARKRLSVIGTYAQFQGGFGLSAYAPGPVLTGSIVMGVLLAAGFVYLLVRLLLGSRKSS